MNVRSAASQSQSQPVAHPVARPGPVEGLVMFTAGVAVLAVMFVIEAQGLTSVDLLNGVGDIAAVIRGGEMG